MTYEVRLTPEATSDLRSIFEYIEFDLQSVQNAAGQLDRLEQGIASLEQMPERFQAYEKEPWKSRNLRSMRQSNIIVFTFGTFLFKICTKRFIPVADIFRSIVKGIAQVSGTTFLHVGIAIIQLPGLISRWRHSGICKYLICRIKTVEITNLGNNHSSHPITDTGNGKDRGFDFFIHDLLGGCFNFINLSS